MICESHPPQDGVYRIWVPGIPAPYPKKDVGIIGYGGKCRACGKPKTQRLLPVDKDYRTRKDPITGKTQKWDKGYKRRWMALVKSTVSSYMSRHCLDPFPAKHPVAMGTLFFMPQAKGNKLPYPSQKPDLDNLRYSIWNALGKDSKSKKRADGIMIDNGTLYYDDSQIVWTLSPDGMLWASDRFPSGVLITACSADRVSDRIIEAITMGAEDDV